MRFILLFVLLSSLVHAQLISDFPSFAKNAVIIKGDVRSGDEIMSANLLVKYLNSKDVRLASQVSSIDRPVVLVGTPCNNLWIRKLLGLLDCSVKSDLGFVVVSKVNGFPVVIVSGDVPVNVFRSAKWLTGKSHFNYPVGFVVLRKTVPQLPLVYGETIAVGTPLSKYGAVVQNENSYVRFPGGKVIFGKN